MVTQEENTVTVAFKENLDQRLSIVPASHTSREFISPIVPEKLPASPTDREFISPIVPEKPSEDGYNWRKYGQKNVKGNVYIRSYYKCSYLNCRAKKQVERSREGRITDVSYLGEHKHVQLHTGAEEAVQVQIQDCPPLVVDEDTPLDEHAPATDIVRPIDVCKSLEVAIIDDKTPISVTPLSQQRDESNENLTPKRRKKGADGADMMLEKPSNESRVVIQTVSEVDIVNDGYRWRKYGQKMVKGSPNPRSYYRCSTAGCPVKKHVERASHDPKVVITTYEGHHEHTLPPVRILVAQTPPPPLGGLESDAVGKSKLEETDTTAPETSEKDALAIVVKIDNEISSSKHEVNSEPDNGYNIDQMLTEEEKATPILVDIKSENAPTEQQEAEAPHDADTNSNGLQQIDAEPVIC